MIISIIFGMLPDILYFWSMLLVVKNEKRHKLLLFLMIMVAYVLLIPIIRYSYILYIIFAILIYLSLKILYKSEIVDFFVIIMLFDYMMIISFVCYFAFNNYAIASIINRISLFIPLLLHNKLNKWYNLYRGLWNRNEHSKIKSLTLRNICIIVLNTTITLMYMTLLIVYQNMI